ncbi:MAG TPA: PKD domain-containing protein [Thermoanaerobaculia bacterium]|nr:PKD domain-containing protein [Thermoanaerobaculia bacterium]
MTPTSTRRGSRLSLALLLAVLGWGCDSADPVAPPGTTLTISASPTRIASDGAAQIRVVARRPNGTPVNPGTVVLLSTTVGSIPPSVPVDDRGEALTLLQGNGEFGTATVSASVGGEAVTVEVQVGLPAGSISIQASPSSVAETGGKVNLLALVRDDQGRPLAGATANFASETGTLQSGGAFLTTDGNGEARDVLNVSAGDLDVVQGDSFQVAAEVGGATGSVLSDTITLSIQRLPVADFTFGTNNLTVVFTDTSTGFPNKWLWDFGDGNTSTRQNPSHTYSDAGTYVVTLTATNSQGSDTVSKFVSVSGQ